MSFFGLVSCAHSRSVTAPTAAEQAELTPDGVLEDLMAGNARFVDGYLSAPDVKLRRMAGTLGQYPKAVVLSCLDSRVPVEQVFDQGIGDLFVGRVAGNVENEDQLGSMEFAAKLSGVKLVMVLGHSACGAVKGACDGAEMGNLTALLSKIQPAVDSVEGFPTDQRNSKNSAFVERVVRANVQMTVADIRSRSPILAQMERDGQIKIVGAVYSLESGEVTLL
ncbi:MAG: carbonic anhydrase family protein [Planctomycetota bacterium]